MAKGDYSTERFAHNLRTLRTEATFSQEFLAHRSGVHASEISRLEKGERDPRLTTIVKLAKGLSVSVGILTDGVTGPPKPPKPAPAPVDIYSEEWQL